jgi:hypothetical protein
VLVKRAVAPPSDLLIFKLRSMFIN